MKRRPPPHLAGVAIAAGHRKEDPAEVSGSTVRERLADAVDRLRGPKPKYVDRPSGPRRIPRGVRRAMARELRASYSRKDRRGSTVGMVMHDMIPEVVE
ncbi:MAG: hypothetical protein OXC11_00825 [Rhodospirillales bacterium]|nr:hypothetical protein [Rhodospirillales bacterium]